MGRRPSASFMRNSPLIRLVGSPSTVLPGGASRALCFPIHLDSGSGLGEFEKDKGSSIEECSVLGHDEGSLFSFVCRFLCESFAGGLPVVSPFATLATYFCGLVNAKFFITSPMDSIASTSYSSG